MNILFITKYPPIEGGTSSRAYWLIKELAKKGNKIFVVTNARGVEKEYKTVLSKSDEELLEGENIKLFDISDAKIPHYIPYSRPEEVLLANKALQIILKNKIDVICSWYLLPYGVAGMLASSLSGIPHIVKHAGSDLARLLQSFSFSNILFEVIRRADLIMTTQERRAGFIKSGISKNKIFCDSNHTCADHSFFNPDPKKFKIKKIDKILKNKIPVITFLGKLDETKGVFELLNSLSDVKDKFYLLLVSSDQNKELDKLIIKNKMEHRVIRTSFILPWKVPSIISGSRAIVILERNFTVKRHVNVLINEVMAVGKCLILSEEVYENNKRISNLKKGKNVLVVNVGNDDNLEKMLSKVIKNKKLTSKIGKAAYKTEKKSKKMNLYVNNFLKACQQVLKIKK